MSALSKPGFLKWLVIVLLLVNAATLAYLFVGDRNNKPFGPRRGKDFIVKELNFTEEQKVKHDSLHKIFANEQEAIFSRIKLLKDSLYFKSTAKNDTAQLNAFTTRIGTEFSALEKETFLHFQRVRNICTPQQQVKLDTIINHLNNMQRGSKRPQ